MSEVLSARPPLLDALRSRGAVASMLRGTAGSCLNKVIANGLMFGVQIVFARQLGLTGYGVYALAIAWLSVLVLVGRLGYDLATVRFVSTYHGKKEWALLRGFLRSGRIAVLLASVLAGAALAIGAATMRDRIGDGLAEALIVTSASVPLMALVQVEAAALRGMGRVVVGDLPFSIAHPLLLLAGFLGAVIWLDAATSAATAMSAYFGALVLVLAWLRAMLRSETPSGARRVRPAYRLREWLTTAPAMMLIAGFSVVLNQSSTIVVGAFSGAEAAAIYGAAARISAILQIVVFSLVAAIGPLAARLSAEGELGQLQRAVDAGVSAVFAIAIAAALTTAVLGTWLLGLFGEAFVAGYTAMIILIGGQIAAAAVAPAAILLNMSGHQNTSAHILTAAALGHLALCALLTDMFGPLGAATATAMTTAAMSVAMAIAVHRKLGLRSWISLAGLRLRSAT